MLCSVSLPLLNSFVKTRYVTHKIHDIQMELQSVVMMDRAHPLYSTAMTVTVATETCRLSILNCINVCLLFAIS